MTEKRLSALENSLPADSERPLRIALFTETFLPRIDGTVTRLCHTVRQLRRLGHEVLVFAPEGGLTEFEGVRIHGVPGFPFPLYPELKLSLPRRSIGKALAGFQPDLIHAVQPVVLGASAFYYSVRMELPLVVSYHTHLPKWLRYYKLGVFESLLWWALKSSFNRADLVLCTSQVIHTMLREKGIQRVRVWQRGVDTEGFQPDRESMEMRTRLTDGHPEDRLLLYVGRLSAEKDIPVCRSVLEATPEARLAVVGDGPQRSQLEQYFAGTRTHFAGYLRGPELAAAYASADVFLLPSRTETLGLVLLEAMAAGCPVVAAAEGGILDIIEDGVTGCLFDPLAPSSAIAAVRRLLSDDAYRENMRRRARVAVEPWGWAAATRQLEGFYRHLLRREQELPKRIAEQARSGHSVDNICDVLEISHATARRHVDIRRGLAAR